MILLESYRGYQPTVQQGSDRLPAALIPVGHGLDFADALHLSSRPPGATFISFDHSLVRRAKRAGVADVSEIKTA